MNRLHKKNQSAPIAQPGQGGFINGLAMGAALGAAAYFLLATEKGKKVRDELIDIGKEYVPELKTVAELLKEETPKKVAKAKQEVKQLAAKATQTAEKLPEIKAEIEAELQQLEDSVIEAKQKADQMQTELQQAASKIEKKFFVRKGKSLQKKK